MTDDFDRAHPFSPPALRGGVRYDTLTAKTEPPKAAAQETAQPEAKTETAPASTVIRQKLFNLNFEATSEKEADSTEEARLLLAMIFKPLLSGYKLRPQETQLILANANEILKEMEVERQAIVEAQKQQEISTTTKD